MNRTPISATAHRSFRAAAALCVAVALASCGQDSGTPAPTAPAAPDQPPATGSVTPASGTGKAQTFTATYTHPQGAKQVATAWFLVENKLTGSNACFVIYDPTANRVTLMDNAGKPQTPVPAGGKGTLSNSQCSVDGAAVRGTSAGDTLTVTFPITFAASYSGPKQIFMLAGGPKVHSGWVQKGSWVVP